MTEKADRSENAQREADQRRQISYLKQLNFDRNLGEVEISFKPSAEHWARIAEAYKKTKSPNTIVSYSEAPMIAERAENYWRVSFQPVQRQAGSVGFEPVTTNEPYGVGFEDVIRAATIDLIIVWSDKVKTIIQPQTGHYPTTVAVSQDRIAYTLRPSVITLNLSDLKEKPTILMRGANYPGALRFRSLDNAVVLDQVIGLNWADKDDGSYEAKMMPFAAGPYRLNVTFKADAPSSF